MNKKSAMEVASAYLNNRMRTVAEVKKRLAEKEFSDQEIEKTVCELIELKYLDDAEFARRYYEYNAEKKRGSFRAMRELEEKGVDKQTIKFALEDFLYESKIDEYEMAMEIAKREIEDSEIDEKLKGKIARKLDNRGFSKDNIIRVLNSLK